MCYPQIETAKFYQNAGVMTIKQLFCTVYKRISGLSPYQFSQQIYLICYIYYLWYIFQYCNCNGLTDYGTTP